MTEDRRNVSILRKIIKYCDEIADTIALFGDSPESLSSNKIYQNASAMCILQIGELAGHLSENFRRTHPTMPWQDIKAMRNFAAHDYEKFEVKFLWGTMINDVPALRAYCQSIVEHQEPTAGQ
jgi:uncharacterized protein with HEPN domain